jgi:hypothetical protein
MKQFILIILFAVSAFYNVVIAQSNEAVKLTISGEISEYFSNKIMQGVSIKLLEGGSYVHNVVSDEKGKYSLELAFDKEYTVLYEKAGFVAKKILVNTKSVSKKERNSLSNLLVDMTLFKEDKELAVAFLDQPIGKAQYDSNTKEIDWDMKYTGPIAGRLNGVLTAYKAKIQAVIDEEKRKEQEFVTLMKSADKAFFKKDFDIAKASYQKALSLKPNHSEPKNRIDLIDIAIAKKAEADRLKKETEERAAAEEKARIEAEVAMKKAEEERIAKEKAEAIAKEKAAAEDKARLEAAESAKLEQEERLAKEKAEAEVIAAKAAEEKAQLEAAAAAKHAEADKLAKEAGEAMAKEKAVAE